MASRGVGEPMVALYTRVYLALCGSELLPPSDKTAVLSSLFDYFFSYNQFQINKLENWLQTNNMTQEDYLALHSPAVEWLMKCTATECHADAFETIVAHYRQYSDNSMVLKHLCESFGPQFYASKPLVMLHLMRLSTPSQYTKCHLYSLLALQLSTSPTLTTTKEGKLQFLNEAWTSITSQEEIAQYMECAAAFMKLIVAHFSVRRCGRSPLRSDSSDSCVHLAATVASRSPDSTERCCATPELSNSGRVDIKGVQPHGCVD